MSNELKLKVIEDRRMIKNMFAHNKYYWNTLSLSIDLAQIEVTNSRIKFDGQFLEDFTDEIFIVFLFIDLFPLGKVLSFGFRKALLNSNFFRRQVLVRTLSSLENSPLSSEKKLFRTISKYKDDDLLKDLAKLTELSFDKIATGESVLGRISSTRYDYYKKVDQISKALTQTYGEPVLSPLGRGIRSVAKSSVTALNKPEKVRDLSSPELNVIKKFKDFINRRLLDDEIFRNLILAHLEKIEIGVVQYMDTKTIVSDYLSIAENTEARTAGTKFLEDFLEDSIKDNQYFFSIYSKQELIQRFIEQCIWVSILPINPELAKYTSLEFEAIKELGAILSGSEEQRKIKNNPRLKNELEEYLLTRLIDWEAGKTTGFYFTFGDWLNELFLKKMTGYSFYNYWQNRDEGKIPTVFKHRDKNKSLDLQLKSLGKFKTKLKEFEKIANRQVRM